MHSIKEKVTYFYTCEVAIYAAEWITMQYLLYFSKNKEVTFKIYTEDNKKYQCTFQLFNRNQCISMFTSMRTAWNGKKRFSENSIWCMSIWLWYLVFEKVSYAKKTESSKCIVSSRGEKIIFFLTLNHCYMNK